MSRVNFPCPLCRDVGRIVTLEAELEPEPPLMIVTDLHGGCAHAAAFGALEGQTLEEAWALIDAALDASGRLRPSSNRRAEASRPRPRSN